MKKTFNINLAGYPFTIDEDAYQLLKDYLETIRGAYAKNEESNELAADIECRIAELLIQNESGEVMIITLDEISKVIERIGEPSDFIEIEETITPPPYNPQGNENISENYTSPFHKKLFRNPQNAMLGGVCSGLAYYFGIDVTIIRLLTVLLFFLSASTVAIVYIILWIVVPEARTPLQRMQMMGQNPTMENIGKTVTENFQEENGTNPNLETPRSGFGVFLSNVCSIFVKCLVILCLIICIPVMIAILLVLVGCIIAFFVGGTALIGGNIFGETLNFKAPGGGVLAFYLLLATLGAIITIGVPFWLLIRMAFMKRINNLSATYRRSLLLIWLIGIALTAVFTVKTVKKARMIDKEALKEQIIENVNIDDSGLQIESSSGKTITIDDSGIKIEKRKEAMPNESGDIKEEIETPIIELSSITETTTDTIP